jgi:uncharacterized protein YehS (DUF1456 family)
VTPSPPHVIARNEAISTHANQQTFVSQLPISRWPFTEVWRFADCLIRRLVRSSMSNDVIFLNLHMSNNDIMKKLRVALKFTDDDIIKVLDLANFRITKTELGAIFRKEDHPNFKPCGDQILRNFLNGLIIHMRGPKE